MMGKDGILDLDTKGQKMIGAGRITLIWVSTTMGNGDDGAEERRPATGKSGSKDLTDPEL